MRELGLFEQYLIQLRQTKLQASHQAMIGGITEGDLEWARVYAFEAELAAQVLTALRALSNDPGLFIKEYLK